jgi:hypothetical protein
MGGSRHGGQQGDLGRDVGDLGQGLPVSCPAPPRVSRPRPSPCCQGIRLGAEAGLEPATMGFSPERRSLVRLIEASCSIDGLRAGRM